MESYLAMSDITYMSELILDISDVKDQVLIQGGSEYEYRQKIS